MLEKLLKKLIKTSSGKWGNVMAIVGLSIAMVLILFAVQLQVNYNELLHGKANQDSVANFLVVNKIVSNDNIGNTHLLEREIQDLKKQSFIDAVGLITSSQFKISADGGNALPFNTDLFFESVPDEFLDINNPDWQWNENSGFIPVVIPNMFLDLYNFGFATSQGSPQLSQEVIRQIPLHITIYSPTGQVNYPGRVVGFSDRISSILVPQSFMEWANAKYGNGKPASTSRVVIRTEDPGNPQLTEYLAQNSLKTDVEKTRFSRYREIVNFVVSISWATGLVMLLFALLIFSLFIELTIMSAKEEVKLLLTLGSGPKQLKKFLMRQFFPKNIFIALVVLIIVVVFQYIFFVFLRNQNMYVSPFISIFTVATALLILLVLYLVNRRTVSKVAE